MIVYVEIVAWLKFSFNSLEITAELSEAFENLGPVKHISSKGLLSPEHRAKPILLEK